MYISNFGNKLRLRKTLNGPHLQQNTNNYKHSTIRFLYRLAYHGFYLAHDTSHNLLHTRTHHIDRWLHTADVRHEKLHHITASVRRRRPNWTNRGYHSRSRSPTWQCLRASRHDRHCGPLFNHRAKSGAKLPIGMCNCRCWSCLCNLPDDGLERLR